MREARVEPDAGPRTGQKRCDLCERHGRRNDGAVHSRRDALRALALLGASPWKDAAHASTIEAPGKLDPAFVAPKLSSRARGVDQDHVRLRGKPGKLGRRRRYAVIEPPRHGVAERLGRKRTIALHRVQRPRHRECAAVEEAQRLARARPVEAKARTARASGNHRALEEPLCIDHRIVSFASQLAEKSPDLAQRPVLPESASPAADRDLQHPPHPRMQPGQRGKRVFDDPVDLAFGMHCAKVARDGKVVDDVSHRRGLYEQDLHDRPARREEMGSLHANATCE